MKFTFFMTLHNDIFKMGVVGSLTRRINLDATLFNERTGFIILEYEPFWVYWYRFDSSLAF